MPGVAPMVGVRTDHDWVVPAGSVAEAPSEVESRLKSAEAAAEDLLLAQGGPPEEEARLAVEDLRPDAPGEARDPAADVVVGKGCVFVNLSREETLAQRAVWHKADAEFLTGWQDGFLNGSPPDRILRDARG